MRRLRTVIVALGIASAFALITPAANAAPLSASATATPVATISGWNWGGAHTDGWNWGG